MDFTKPIASVNGLASAFKFCIKVVANKLIGSSLSNCYKKFDFFFLLHLLFFLLHPRQIRTSIQTHRDLDRRPRRQVIPGLAFSRPSQTSVTFKEPLSTFPSKPGASANFGESQILVNSVSKLISHFNRTGDGVIHWVDHQIRALLSVFYRYTPVNYLRNLNQSPLPSGTHILFSTITLMFDQALPFPLLPYHSPTSVSILSLATHLQSC